jgi:mono/diheme cytochrome c family protein
MTMYHIARKLILLTLCLWMAGCSDDGQDKASSQTQTGTTENATQEKFDINRIARGARLYQENCAQCHGPEAQGHPDWQHAKQQGYAAAPPLDGTGPAIKRRKAEMMAVIRNGLKQDGVPVMPGWKGRVSDDEIEDVITWYQALWPEQVYARWRQLDGNKS